MKYLDISLLDISNIENLPGYEQDLPNMDEDLETRSDCCTQLEEFVFKWLKRETLKMIFTTLKFGFQT